MPVDTQRGIYHDRRGGGDTDQNDGEDTGEEQVIAFALYTYANIGDIPLLNYCRKAEGGI